MEASATVSLQNNSEKSGKPRITRLLRSVRRRHLPTTRPPLPSFTGIRDDEDNEQEDEVEEQLDTKIPKVWVMNEKRTSEPTSLEIHIRPPTTSSRSGSEAAFSAKRERAPVQAPSPLSLKPLDDPVARARKERKRKRREILDMPLPDIPQELPDFESSMQEEHPQSSHKPIQCTFSAGASVFRVAGC
ncbi:hypothetical protein PM082_016695 [Marasmius tenuissimus]|nr:hypothetical protein PM082_016695 [Marasmius tenuissimus]